MRSKGILRGPALVAWVVTLVALVRPTAGEDDPPAVWFDRWTRGVVGESTATGNAEIDACVFVWAPIPKVPIRILGPLGLSEVTVVRKDGSRQPLLDPEGLPRWDTAREATSLEVTLYDPLRDPGVRDLTSK